MHSHTKPRTNSTTNYAIQTADMRVFDSHSARVIPEVILMENAGRHIAEHIFKDLRAERVCILAGRGHNGGDGLVAARHLAELARTGRSERSLDIEVYLTRQELRPLCTTMLSALEGWTSVRIFLLNKASCAQLIQRLEEAREAPQPSVFLDAYLGSGVNRPLLSADGFDLPRLVGAWNASTAQRYALDIPSGAGDFLFGRTGSADGTNTDILNADSLSTDPPLIFNANSTLAIQFPRSILYSGALRSRAGRICILHTGFPQSIIQEFTGTRASTRHRARAVYELLEFEHISRYIPALPPSAHKGTRGKVDVYAGSLGTEGAAVLCARAALHSAAGMLRIACNSEQSSQEILKSEPAIMHIHIQSLRTNAHEEKAKKSAVWANCILVGPGWGREAARVQELAELLRIALPLVIDADGLHALYKLYCQHGEIFAQNNTAGQTPQHAHNANPGKHPSHSPTQAIRILCPHPAEAAMLLQPTPPTSHPSQQQPTAQSIARNPFAAATAIARRYSAYCVLKSSTSLIASPNPNEASYHYPAIYDNPNPALGTAGSGDVLSGVIAALLARGIPAEQACKGAVLLHGQAGKICAQEKGIFSASELLAYIAKLSGKIMRREKE